LCIAGRNVKWNSYWKTVWWFLKKLNVELLYDPTIPFLGINAKDLKIRTQTHACRQMFIYNSQKVATI